jgi:hypothetical protein
LECSLSLIDWMQCRYECGYGPEDHHGDLDHTNSIKHGCLVAFLIKWLYVWLKMVENYFYHCAHTRTKGEPRHGQDHPEFMAWMSLYAPRMSQVLKDHIWTQLNLGHMVKQIYNKHKAIWWAWVNMGEPMAKEIFI